MSIKGLLVTFILTRVATEELDRRATTIIQETVMSLHQRVSTDGLRKSVAISFVYRVV
jgi:hypothetical protein